jgi:hypothetical protein
MFPVGSDDRTLSLSRNIETQTILAKPGLGAASNPAGLSLCYEQEKIWRISASLPRRQAANEYDRAD